MKRRLLLSIFTAYNIASVVTAQADRLDDYVKAQMKKYDVPGLSLAVVDGGKIVETRCHGVVKKGTRDRVTPATLFQAASISKCVTGVGALTLVDKRALNLDEDVNVKLKSWKIPENEFTRDQKVTLRRLLSHTAGLNIHGFHGYEVGSPLPTSVQILNGAPPSNSPPVVVESVPGTMQRYSGGGFVVVRQLIEDVTGVPFGEYMKRAVLEPAGMSESSYDQPIQPGRVALTAAGVNLDGSVLKNRWHTYPELGPDGLWTTPTDLAKFILAVHRSYLGQAGSSLTQSMAVQMLTDQTLEATQRPEGPGGLGSFLRSEGDTLQFTHGGRNWGFDCYYVGYAKAGRGMAVMMNRNDDSNMLFTIAQVVAAKFDWPAFERLSPLSNTKPYPVDPKTRNALLGYYNAPLVQETQTLDTEHGRLILRSDILIDELIFASNDEVIMPDQARKITLVTDASGTIVELVVKTENGEVVTRKARICGPIATVGHHDDPLPGRTANVKSLFTMIAVDGSAVANASYLSPGLKKDLVGSFPAYKGIDEIEYLGEDDLPGSRFSRHGSEVSHIAKYRIRQSGKTHFAIIFLTVTGLIADFDVVER